MIKNVIEYLKNCVQKYPNKVAFADENGQITFYELEQQVQKVAYAITKRINGDRNRPIAVYMEKSINCIIAFMGIVYSGNFYSPIDLKMPVNRIKRILDVLRPGAVIYNTQEPRGFAEDIERISMKRVQSAAPLDCNIEGYLRVLDVDPVYVLFTSGSTGQPKGVVISHRSVIDYTEWLCDKLGFGENTIFGNQAPFYFDNSVLDIYATIKCGGTMNIIPERFFAFPHKVLEYINRNKINTLFWVPSALIGVANSSALSEIRLENIEKIMFCGEVMPNKQLNIWRRKYPNVLYVNLYGPTEITDVCTYFIVDREFSDEEPLPIGFACENTEILVLNENDNLVGNDEIGELCVRGTCLSMGYYGDFNKSKEVFVQNPLNHEYNDLIYRTGDLVKYNAYGELVYICRKDNQIKHQGYRIELGEIENVCGSLDGIERVCVVYDEFQKRIVLFCSLNSNYKDIKEREIYAGIKQHLPSYMLPGLICIKDNLPLNLNGKIDRQRLKEYLEEKVDD